MRRIRRAEALRDHQDRVKMGLLPPDPPKVKLSNMMRVLTQEAVADPTKIEARVRTEMMQRKLKHDRDNEARKLTKEEKREKLEAKAAEVEKRGIHAAAYKIKHLANPSHKFKVRKNAEQLYLTGVCLYAPKFALVIVEGSAASLKKYKRLMLHRIIWTEQVEAAHASVPADADDPDGPAKEAPVVDLSENTCVLVWEGEQRDRIFGSGFHAKGVPSDHLAREYLGPKAEGIYDSARKMDEVAK
jgi:U4/U6 small nuclear ribonucleoprotein PRP3